LESPDGFPKILQIPSFIEIILFGAELSHPDVQLEEADSRFSHEISQSLT